MVAILELPDVRQRVSPISVEELPVKWPEFNESGRRTELIRGLVIEKMGKSPLHSLPCSGPCFSWCKPLPTRSGCLFSRRNRLRWSDSEPEPDISVVATQGDDIPHRTPYHGSARHRSRRFTSVILDREKAALYAEANVQEYWIVLANDEAIEVHTAPSAGRYTQSRVYKRGETLPSVALPTLRVDLDALFAA